MARAARTPLERVDDACDLLRRANARSFPLVVNFYCTDESNEGAKEIIRQAWSSHEEDIRRALAVILTEVYRDWHSAYPVRAHFANDQQPASKLERACFDLAMALLDAPPESVDHGRNTDNACIHRGED